jgi:hypothetical protein
MVAVWDDWSIQSADRVCCSQHQCGMVCACLGMFKQL